MVLASVFSSLEDAVTFVVSGQPSRGDRSLEVGGLSEMADLTGNHFAVSATAVAFGILIALPLGMTLGHYGRAQFLAVSVANVGRAVPALAIIGFCIAWLGSGFTNVAVALTLLAIPPILTNTYVGVRQVDPDLIDAARGQGMSEAQIAMKVELPLALPTIFGGIRLSMISVLATAIIAPEAGYLTLGEPIISFNVYGESGQIGAALLIAVLTLITDGLFVLAQKLSTPKGLRVARERRRMPISLLQRSPVP